MTVGVAFEVIDTSTDVQQERCQALVHQHTMLPGLFIAGKPVPDQSETTQGGIAVLFHLAETQHGKSGKVRERQAQLPVFQRCPDSSCREAVFEGQLLEH